MTPAIDLQEFDRHIQNVQAQITFLSTWLDTVHDDDWLATELITLKGGTSMLQDKWKHLRRKLGVQGSVPALDNTNAKASEKKGDKRLSIEGVTSLNLESRNGSRSGTPLKESSSSSSAAHSRKRSRGELTPPVRAQHTRAHTEEQQSKQDADSGYEVQYVDVTEVVNRRMRESRLRQLMESAPTSQKRKREASEDGGGAEQNGTHDAESILASMMSPTKKLKTFGEFEQLAPEDAGKGVVKKRIFSTSDGDPSQDGEKVEDGRVGAKRRRKA